MSAAEETASLRRCFLNASPHVFSYSDCVPQGSGVELFYWQHNKAQRKALVYYMRMHFDALVALLADKKNILCSSANVSVRMHRFTEFTPITAVFFNALT